MKSHTATKPMTWVKDRDGNTYICPKEALVDSRSFEKKALRKACIDESEALPWND